MRIVLLLFLAAAAAPSVARAQTAASSTPTDTLFLRAQRLVNEGEGARGRALMDSLVNAAPPGSERRAEALYRRAMLASTAAEAERDYRRLTVEHPLSPWTEDALIMLGQLELARRDYTMALRHLERLVREHPRSNAVPRARFWMARAHLDQGDLPRACATLASARAATPRSNVELHNQIDFHAQRCLGVDTSVIAASDATVQPVSPPSAPPTSTPPVTARDAATPTRDTAARPRDTAAQTRPAPSRTPPTSGAPPRGAAATESGARATAPSAGVQYTVQIAALNVRAQAEELRDKLRARGYDARVVGAGQLFRVRIGRYATREEAARLAAEIRQRGISRDAWVAEAEAR